MAFIELELKRIEKTVGQLCLRRSPAHLTPQLRLEYRVKGHEVLIVERGLAGISLRSGVNRSSPS